MNVSEFTYLLQHPEKVVNPLQTKHLEEILEEYPYFQAARAMHLKGLRNLNSYKYNKALKTTAAHTTDREVLFQFITSPNFLQTETPDGKAQEASAPALETLANPQPLIAPSEDRPLPQNTTDAEHILDPGLFNKKEEAKTLELGTPLPFDKEEKHSFAQWLQLTEKKPIRRKATDKDAAVPEGQKSTPGQPTRRLPEREDKFSRIDRFIANNPKIVPKNKNAPATHVETSLPFDKNELMTATLARVYVEQKKYVEAIQAYKILSLKYPEKSSFFADRIKAVEKLKQENK
ncbi:hypothetical protein [Maribacter sp. 2307ULW6-5]|uniref:hypothetical protein n=1 Tax=Maribacter sp. 2307ULW6-5 TaxID=3386275 RepID=UPI0039BD8FCC